MIDLNIYASGLAMVLALSGVAWLASIPMRDASIAERLWPLLLLALTLVYITLAPSLAARSYLMLFLVTVWATRLSVFVTLRGRGLPEDRRYQALRAKSQPGFWRKSFYLVFSLQAIFAWIISLPLLAGILSSAPLGWLDYGAALLWLIGFGFEAIADQQLAAFKADPANRRQVLDRGLWRYTRHPNYFGEVCIWWGFYLFALSAGAWWSIVSPLLLTLLLRGSAVQLLEGDIGARRPAYPDYRRRTPALFPRPPGASKPLDLTPGDNR